MVNLTHWINKKICWEDIEHAYDRASPSDLIIKIDFDGSSQPHVAYKTTPPYYLLETLRVIKQIAQANPQLRGPLLMSLHDGATHPYSEHVPVLTFGKKIHDQHSILIPEPLFMASEGYLQNMDALNELGTYYPWDSRNPTAYWRGVSTGAPLTPENWTNNTRVRLASLSAKLKDPSFLDAYLSRVVQCDKDSPVYKQIYSQGLVKATVPFREFIRHKYLIEVDGNFCTWNSLFRKLYTDSVILKVSSDNILWYSHKLQPWEHYVPIAEDLSDLPEKIRWSRNHDLECREINQKATQVAKGLSYSYALNYTTEIITTLLSSMDHS